MSSILDINEILESYVTEIQDEITSCAERIADEGVSKLKNTKNTYKIRSGKYNKGWSKRIEKGGNYVNATIYNRTDYQLTHLLEDGHVTKNGNLTKAYKHISPVESVCNDKFENEVEEIIRRLSK